MSRVLPILFNGDMVRAILDGGKTVTRRAVKPQQLIGLLPDKCKNATPEEFLKEKKYMFKPYCDMTDAELIKTSYKLPYQPGDILYVRETWGMSNLNYDDKIAYIVYKASENEKDEGCRAVRLPNDKFEKLYDSMAENNPDWHPSIHMPKEAARIWLKVKDVRVERLHDAKYFDFIHEGLSYKQYEWEIREDFQLLWNSTIKKSDIDRYGWDANPWVWVIEFERCEKQLN